MRSEEIQKRLNGQGYEVGQLEAIEYTGVNTAVTLSNLLELLQEKGVITDKEVKDRIVSGFYGDDWTF